MQCKSICSYTESPKSHNLYFMACVCICIPCLQEQGSNTQTNWNVFVLVLYTRSVNQHLLLLTYTVEELKGVLDSLHSPFLLCHLLSGWWKQRSNLWGGKNATGFLGCWSFLGHHCLLYAFKTRSILGDKLGFPVLLVPKLRDLMCLPCTWIESC